MYYLTNKYCCTCLSTESENLTDLTSLDYDSISFYEKLTTCIPNRIAVDMKIQENFLCDECSKNVTQYYDFHTLCMKSKDILDNIGLKIQYFKVGEENTVVNIVPNDYYTFDDTENATDDIQINDITSNETTHVVTTEDNKEEDDNKRVETKRSTKKKRFKKSTSDLVNSILKDNKVIPESLYTCNLCNEKFNKKGLLIVHITVEHSNQLFCHICDKQFGNETEYKTHLEVHSDETKPKQKKKDYTCNYCKRVFQSNSALFRHKKIHTNDRRYACDLCSVRYIQKAQIVNHITKYHPGHVYEEKKCQTCRKIFETKNDLEIHNKINHELKFDLKTLEKLQSTNGNIKNIIECFGSIEPDEYNISDSDIIENIEINDDNVNIIDLDIIENGNIDESIEDIELDFDVNKEKDVEELF